MTRKQLLSHSHIADTSNFGTGEYGEAHTKAAKKKIPSQIPIKAVSRAMGFILHAAFLFCLLHKAQLYHTVIQEIVLFVPSLFSAVSLCPPSWPGKKYFFFATNEL